MPALAEIRVIPQHLDETYRRLFPYFKRLENRGGTMGWYGGLFLPSIVGRDRVCHSERSPSPEILFWMGQPSVALFLWAFLFLLLGLLLSAGWAFFSKSLFIPDSAAPTVPGGTERERDRLREEKKFLTEARHHSAVPFEPPGISVFASGLNPPPPE